LGTTVSVLLDLAELGWESLQSAQERQFDDFALVGRFDHTRLRAALRQRPMQAVTMIIV